MFSGIVETMVRFKGKKKKADIYQITVELNSPLGQLEPGESIALDGVCLTLKRQEENLLSFDLLEETYQHTRFKYLKLKELINLERALKLNKGISGHLLTGHIDCLLPVQFLERRNKSRRVYLRVPKPYRFYVVEKGSIAVNGVSLTIQEIKNDLIALELIPFTLQKTNLSQLKPGDKVNVEFDILAKYVANYLKNARG